MILNRELEEDSVLNFGSLDVELEKCIFGTLQISGMQWEQEVNKKQKRQEGYCHISTMPFLCLLGWDGIYFGYGVTTALKIVQRSTPFLTRHFASRLGGVYSNEQSPPQPKLERPLLRGNIYEKSTGVS